MKHLKTFEYYDSEIEQEFTNLSKKDIEQMAYPDDIKGMFRYGLYAGSNSVYLNDIINDVMRSSSNTKDTFAIMDESYRILVNKIPILRTFEKNKEHFEDNASYLNLKKSVDIIVKNTEYVAECSIYVVYHKKDDDLMEYQKDKLKFGFFVGIKPKKKSISLYDTDIIGALDSGDDENFDNALSKLGKMMYGSPDKEDSTFTDSLTIMENNIELKDLHQIGNRVKDHLMKFNMYITDKYKITLY